MMKHDPKGKVRIKLDETVIGSAKMSPCERYRYRLERIWDKAKPTIVWIGMNPSTADGLHDDPTCARELTFSKTWGFGHYIKANVLDWRATFPKDIPTDPTLAASAEGRAELLKMAKEAELVMAAWGKLPPKLAGQSDAVAQLLESHGIELMCLGINKDGSPKHPLYLRKDLTPQKWRDLNPKS